MYQISVDCTFHCGDVEIFQDRQIGDRGYYPNTEPTLTLTLRLEVGKNPTSCLKKKPKQNQNKTYYELQLAYFN